MSLGLDIAHVRTRARHYYCLGLGFAISLGLRFRIRVELRHRVRATVPVKYSGGLGDHRALMRHRARVRVRVRAGTGLGLKTALARVKGSLGVRVKASLRIRVKGRVGGFHVPAITLRSGMAVALIAIKSSNMSGNTNPLGPLPSTMQDYPNLRSYAAPYPNR